MKKFVCRFISILLVCGLMGNASPVLAEMPVPSQTQTPELKEGMLAPASVIVGDEKTTAEPFAADSNMPYGVGDSENSEDESEQKHPAMPQNSSEAPLPNQGMEAVDDAQDVQEPEDIQVPEDVQEPADTQKPEDAQIPEDASTNQDTQMTANGSLSQEDMTSAWDQPTYNEIMQATGKLLELDENQLQEYLDRAYHLRQMISEGQLTLVDGDITELSNAIAAMEDVLSALEAKKSGTLDSLPQTGKENSWRYLNGEKIENDLTDSISGAVAFSVDDYVGIDVSHHQGVIDWESVKRSGIDFAIIRCGYGLDLESQDDKQWERNASECERLGIPYGVYMYSYATSVEGAASEAQHALRLLNGHTPSLPVFYDLEENRTAIVGNEMIGSIAQTFCNTLQKNGYQVGIYANLNWWNNYLTAQEFQNSSWFRWVAEWRASCSYGGRYEMWQYTNQGSVSGIAGNVDMDYWYGSSLYVQNTLQQEQMYSAVYDYQYYVRHSSDLAHMYRMQAIEHFVYQGMREGRQAIDDFNPWIYQQNYADLRNAYQDDIVQYYYHYMYAGKAEGREGGALLSSAGITVYNGLDYSSVYNYTYYTQHNPDVYASFQGDAVQTLAHFVNQGMREGRQANEEFNPDIYKYNYSDLRATYGENTYEYYIHYIYTGKSEGRKANEKIQRVPIVVYNGLDYSLVYDFAYYCQANPDVAEYYNEDDYAILAHFVLYGMKEARQGNESFNVRIYRDNYADLRQSYAENMPAYYLHYIYAGKAEGRVADTPLP